MSSAGVSRTVGATIFALSLLAISEGSPADEGGKPPRGEKDWHLTLGAGGIVGPDYEGSDDYEATPLPLFELSWRDTVSIGTIGGPGLKVNYFKLKGPTPKDHLILSASAGYGGGRDQDDNDALQGLGDLDAGVILGLGANYQYQNFGISLGINHDVTGDREGTTVSAGASYSFALGSPKTLLTLGTGLTWADGDYMSNVFGISGTQVAASRSGFATFDASSGLKDIGVNAMLMHRWDENIGLMGQAGYSRLLGDAADSPIVDQEGDAGQFSVLLGVTYSWGW